MANLKSVAFVGAIALYAAFLASPAASQSTVGAVLPRATSTPVPIAGLGLVPLVVGGAALYRILRRKPD
jgi:hypothetical protein